MKPWPAFLLLAALACGPTLAQGDAALYQALGEKFGIARLMADFVGRLKTDSQLGPFFKDSDPKYLAGQLTDQVCQLSGGPCVLDGPNMKAAHESMKIGRTEFNQLVEVLQQTMQARGVPFGTQNQLLARLAPMHRDIINVR